MKLKNFIPTDHFQNLSGLKIKEMRKLTQVVALFGKNGSGKSRLLKSLPDEIRRFKSELDQLKEKIDNEENKEHLNPGQQRGLQKLRRQLRSINENFDCEKNDQVLLISSVNSEIVSAEDMKDNEYRQSAIHNIANPEFITVKENCLKLIKSLCKSEISQTYHNAIEAKKFYLLHDENQEKNIQLLRLLKEVINQIMHKNLEYQTDEHLTPILTLNNRPIRLEELSDGEKELLAYCTFLVLQQQPSIENNNLSLKGKILLIDEVELFLHPEAQIKLINGLRNLVGVEGQLWIATHSLAILSILDRDEIWLMQDSMISNPSLETPSTVLSSLVGEDHIEKFESFISSQYEWASINLAMESLFSPVTIPFKANDEQQEQIINRLTPSKNSINILDFGAGQGRMAMELLRNENLLQNIAYSAYEIEPKLHKNLIDLCTILNEKSTLANKGKLIDSINELNKEKFKNSFDYIFMVNVLHEIKIHEWDGVLNCLINTLAVSGKLIILEDQFIPRGELAHEFGFLILDFESFQELFSKSTKIKQFPSEKEKYKDRLLCIEVCKNRTKVNKSSILAALNKKKENCLKEIVRIRNMKNNIGVREGRMHAFQMQLYANVDMALTELNNSSAQN